MSSFDNFAATNPEPDPAEEAAGSDRADPELYEEARQPVILSRLHPPSQFSSPNNLNS